VKTDVYTFVDFSDGAEPTALVRESDGSFYGTMGEGGVNSNGTFFHLTPSGTKTVLYAFDATTDVATRAGGGAQVSGDLLKLAPLGHLHPMQHATGVPTHQGLPGGVHHQIEGFQGNEPEQALIAHDIRLGLARSLFKGDLDRPDGRDVDTAAVREDHPSRGELRRIESELLCDLLCHSQEPATRVHECADVHTGFREQICNRQLRMSLAHFRGCRRP